MLGGRGRRAGSGNSERGFLGLPGDLNGERRDGLTVGEKPSDELRLQTVCAKSVIVAELDQL